MKSFPLFTAHMLRLFPPSSTWTHGAESSWCGFSLTELIIITVLSGSNRVLTGNHKDQTGNELCEGMTEVLSYGFVCVCVSVCVFFSFLICLFFHGFYLQSYTGNKFSVSFLPSCATLFWQEMLAGTVCKHACWAVGG